MKNALRCLPLIVIGLFPARTAMAADRFTCNMGALTKFERQRDAELAHLMRAALVERKELPNGYGFRFTAESTQMVAEWTYIIAKCCQPLDYRLEIGPQPGGALWL
jgi:hypothetical protein